MADLERFIPTATLNDARVMFRNFSGLPTKFNAEGQRNFCVFLEHDVAEAMANDGWPIKYLNPREEGDLPQAYIKVKVKFGVRPPKLYVITSRGRTQLDESMVSMLDWAEFEKVDLILSPYKYDVNGNRGITAYLQTFFGTIREDELELRYANVPDANLESAQNTLVWQESTPQEVEILKMLEIEQA